MYEFVSETTLSSDAASISLNNLPTDTSGLEIWLKTSVINNTNIRFFFNNDTISTNYFNQILFNQFGPTAQQAADQDDFFVFNDSVRGQQNAIYRIFVPEHGNSGLIDDGILTVAGASLTNQTGSTAPSAVLATITRQNLNSVITSIQIEVDSSDMKANTKVSVYKRIGDA